MNTLLIGRKYNITKKENVLGKTVEKTFVATVHNVKRTEEGLYFGYIPDDIRNGRFGYATFFDTPKNWGVQKMELLPLTSTEQYFLLDKIINQMYDGETFITVRQLREYAKEPDIDVDINACGIPEIENLIRKYRGEEIPM